MLMYNIHVHTIVRMSMHLNTCMYIHVHVCSEAHVSTCVPDDDIIMYTCNKLKKQALSMTHCHDINSKAFRVYL